MGAGASARATDSNHAAAAAAATAAAAGQQQRPSRLPWRRNRRAAAGAAAVEAVSPDDTLEANATTENHAALPPLEVEGEEEPAQPQ